MMRAAAVVLGVGVGLLIAHVRHLISSRRTDDPDLVCGGCKANLGTLKATRDHFRLASILAHLGDCDLLPRESRRAAADLLADDLAPIDWARLQHELLRWGRDGGPHLDPDTIHPAGACEACDAYPDLQRAHASTHTTQELSLRCE